MILDIVRTGWLNLRRDRAALVLSFVLPVVFFSIFAGVFAPQRSKTPTVRLAVVDEDRTEQSRRLIAALDAEPAIIVRRGPTAKDPSVLFDRASAEQYVRAGSAPVALIVPKGFGSAPMRFGPDRASGPQFRLIADSSDPIASNVINGLLQKVIMTADPAAMMRGGIEAMDRWGGGLTPQQKTKLDANMAELEKSRASGSAAENGSLVGVQVSDILGEKKKNPVIAFYAAGIGVMFLLFTASNAGGAILEEHENGTLDRILSTRVTMFDLLLGKLAYLWMLACTQLIVMFVWGALVFGVELTSHLAGFAIMTAVTAFACSAFGLLMASVARTRAQLGALSTMAVLTISALGGSMFPRFMMPESVQKAGLVLFNAWAIDGYTKVFWRDEPPSALILPAVVLIGFGTLFFVIARRLARRWDVS